MYRKILSLLLLLLISVSCTKIVVKKETEYIKLPVKYAEAIEIPEAIKLKGRVENGEYILDGDAFKELRKFIARMNTHAVNQQDLIISHNEYLRKHNGESND